MVDLNRQFSLSVGLLKGQAKFARCHARVQHACQTHGYVIYIYIYSRHLLVFEHREETFNFFLVFDISHSEAQYISLYISQLV